jgi:hypothetical protein
MTRNHSRGGRRSHLALAALAVVAVGRAARPDMRVDRLEVVESAYDTAGMTVTGTSPSAGSVTDRRLRDVKLLPEPPATSPRRHRLRCALPLDRQRDGERAMLAPVWTICRSGRQPTSGNTFRQSVAEFATTIGTSHVRGYSFDEPWRSCRGWTLEIWQGDRKLLEKGFEIVTRRVIASASEQHAKRHCEAVGRSNSAGYASARRALATHKRWRCSLAAQACDDHHRNNVAPQVKPPIASEQIRSPFDAAVGDRDRQRERSRRPTCCRACRP